MQDGFLRAAAASIPVAVADPRRNAAAICARIDQAHRVHAALLVLPELCVTGYTCGDLFLSALLLDAAETALTGICAHTQNCDPVVVLGVPLRAGGKLYNCAAVLHRGRILGVVPKTWLPNYDVFAEKRCFTSAAAYSGPGCVTIGGKEVPFGAGLVFGCAQMPSFRLGVELCEDVWAPVPPSVRLCLAGATVIANCSASPEAAGKPAHRRTLLRAASARGLCGYVYANAGPDESTERAVFSAHHLIAENGTILAEHAPFAPEPGLLVTELDLLTLSAERRRNTTFVPEGEGVRAVTFSMPLRPTPLGRAVSPHPFVPDDASQRTKRAELLLTMQAHGLRKRLLHTGSRAAKLFVGTDELSADRVFAPDDVVTIDDHKGVVAGEGLGHADSVAEAEGLLLADEEDVGQIGDAEALFQHLLLAGSGKFCFQLRAAVKVVLDDVLIAAHDDKDVGDAGTDSLLHQILDGGFVHEGEHSFGHRLGGGQHPGAKTCCRNDRLGDLFHDSDSFGL